MPNEKKQPKAPTHIRKRKQLEPASSREKNDRLAQEIGKRIFEARDGLGFSQQALATRTRLADPDGQGISRAVLSLYETGVNKPGAREIKLLCEALKVTPNWLLYGSDSPAKTLQASLEFLRGSELKLSARLAFAMLALDPEDRDSLSALMFSLLNKKLGDIQLSSLMMMASFMEEALLAKIIELVGEENRDKPIREVLELFVTEAARGFYTNLGNLRPATPEDEMSDFDSDHPPPPRKLNNT